MADDLDVAADGTVYFSDTCGLRHTTGVAPMDTANVCILGAVGGGKLCKYDPATKQVTTLLGGLFFANGVALHPDEEYVLVNDTPT